MPDGSPISWPPDYQDVWGERHRILRAYSTAQGRRYAKAAYAAEPVKWINDWVCTYDPRNALSEDLPATLPLILFPRQEDLVRFVYLCLDGNAGGLIEKCRDMGATWVCAAISVHLWLYRSGASIGWGSRKEQLVDKIGDPDSIFEKIRLIIRRLPRSMLPKGFNSEKHMSFMKIINPETGATITGEAGDNIGRGGRKLIYFKDESAHYERPEKIEAALSDTTRVQIDISSVNGLGNVFHRRREAGTDWEPGTPIDPKRTNVFVMDWRDHPGKSQEWYDGRKAKAVDDGLEHVFAQEVDRNYAASVDGIVIPPEWVEAAIDAHVKLEIEPHGPFSAGFDVADEGLDRNALSISRGIVLQSIENWGDRDTGRATRRVVEKIERFAPLAVQYDSVGVGAGVKAEANRLIEERGDNGAPLLPKGIRFVSWSAGSKVINPQGHVVPDDPESPLNEDFFDNLKAQAWWELRRRFERTYRAITENIRFDPDELISLPSKMPGLHQLRKELSQATMSKGGKQMKLVIDKAPDGTRSPNMADAVVMDFWPADQGSYDATMDWI